MGSYKYWIIICFLGVYHFVFSQIALPDTVDVKLRRLHTVLDMPDTYQLEIVNKKTYKRINCALLRTIQPDFVIKPDFGKHVSIWVKVEKETIVTDSLGRQEFNEFEVEHQRSVRLGDIKNMLKFDETDSDTDPEIITFGKKNFNSVTSGANVSYYQNILNPELQKKLRVPYVMHFVITNKNHEMIQILIFFGEDDKEMVRGQIEKIINILKFR